MSDDSADGDDVHTDFEVAFRPGLTLHDDGGTFVTRVAALGELPITSGAVSLGDAFTGTAPSRPPSGAIAPGSYPVDLGLMEIAEEGGGFTKGDVRSTVARVRFRDGEVARWIRAEVSAEVDSGTCAFTDGDAPWAPADEEAGERLEAALQESAIGPSALALRHDVGGRIVVAFSSGIGDGIYDAYWGMSAEGAPLALCLDFDLLTTSEHAEIVLPWPIRRATLPTAALGAEGLTVKLPLFASDRFTLRHTKKRMPRARWRSPDGRITRPTVKYETGQLEVSLRDRPADAELVLQLPGRRIPLRP